ncbi:hypothetical protein [Halosimplex carlsbadense]|uniref:hypothetical protein n=1 Tax=Halosimplex carlsbadense TaxID=171164 RepID=UPI0012687A59|nr:hypothetical protein [Halosimplex carlsbadense]
MKMQNRSFATILVGVGALFVVWGSMGSWGIGPLALPDTSLLNPNVVKVMYPPAGLALLAAVRGWGKNSCLLSFAAGVFLWLTIIGPPDYVFTGGRLKIFLGGLSFVAAGLIGYYRGNPSISELIPSRPSPPLDGWVAFLGYLIMTVGWIPLSLVPEALISNPENAVVLLLVLGAGMAWCLYLWQPGSRIVSGLIALLIVFILIVRGQPDTSTGLRTYRVVLTGAVVFLVIALGEVARSTQIARKRSH